MCRLSDYKMIYEFNFESPKINLHKLLNFPYYRYICYEKSAKN